MLLSETSESSTLFPAKLLTLGFPNLNSLRTHAWRGSMAGAYGASHANVSPSDGLSDL
jgi:hypothetical protein